MIQSKGLIGCVEQELNRKGLKSMMRGEELRRRLLEDRGLYAKEACDTCGQLLGSVRYTREGEIGEWCSRECRGGGVAAAIRKGGPPRKYRTDDQRRAAKTMHSALIAAVSVWGKTPLQLVGNKGLADAKIGSQLSP